ncbi:bifunctional DNA primase/polymerase [Mobilicoccus sp.]|uniref:bifunctional DNA primase/polymerase n=1 Tax=Mobilicoccus sp. TaxID=2034349 RepID=UPI0028A89930|nr:bifunctional DNA primase/polymerase [Mobilicoccus sp.]
MSPRHETAPAASTTTGTHLTETQAVTDSDSIGSGAGQPLSRSAADAPHGVKAALEIARRGYRVHPVRLVQRESGGYDKQPLTAHGFKDATADEATVRKLWADHKGAHVGIATGNGVVVADLDRKHGKDGVAVWTDVLDTLGLDYTPTAETLTGGQHVFYRTAEYMPGRTDLPIGPDDTPSGVDVRGDGGFVVAYDVPPALVDLPDVEPVADLLTARRKNVDTTTFPEDAPTRDPELGVHPYAAAAVSGEVARLVECAEKGWSGPAWDNTTFEVACNLVEFANSPWSGYSMEQAREDFMENAPADEEFDERLHRDKFNGALKKVGRQARRDPDAPPPSQPSTVVDLMPLIEQLESGTLEPPSPDLAGRLYRGKVNGLIGQPTAGKTWETLEISGSAFLPDDGTDSVTETALFIDFEDSATTMAERCRAMDRRLGLVIRYIKADGPLDLDSIAEIIDGQRVALVVIDSLGEALSAYNLDSNSEKDVTRWMAEVARPIAEMGPGVLWLDHVSKAAGSSSPVGSFRKTAAVNGALYHLDNKVGFSREREGWSKLVCLKDRNGHYATGETVGRVVFTPVTVGPEDARRHHLKVEFRPGPVETVFSTNAMDADIMRVVREEYARRVAAGPLDEDDKPVEPRLTMGAITKMVPGRDQTIRERVADLVDSGALHADVWHSGTKRTDWLYSPGTADFEAVPDGEDGTE